MLGNMPDTQNRKAQILQTAAMLFRERGYQAASMRDIATAMHIEAASLYHHIKSKEEILEIICFDMAEHFLSAIVEVNDIYFNAEEKLRTAILNHVRLITQNQERSAVFLHEWRSLPELSLNQFLTLRNQYENGFKQIVKEGIEEDIFAQVEPKFAVLSILSSVNWINEWYKPDGKMGAEEIAKNISDFVLGGLRKKLVTDLGYKP
jgi:AcrR family transcriptional regulator